MKYFAFFILLFVLGACSTVPDVEIPEGYRMNRYKAPVPNHAVGGQRIEAAQARKLWQEGGVFIDVIASNGLLTRGIDHEWLSVKPHLSIPNSYWLPDVGRGALTVEQERYFNIALSQITAGDRDRPIVFFCLKSCWMSWNATKRANRLGYMKLYWFADGRDGWKENGYSLEAINAYEMKK